MVASWLRVAAAALSSLVAEVENHPLVVLDLVACACRVVEQAFFQEGEVQVGEAQVGVAQREEHQAVDHQVSAAADCHLQLVAVLHNSNKM